MENRVIARGQEHPLAPNPFSAKVRLLQWLDRWLGAPLCLALTCFHRLRNLLRGRDLSKTVKQILIVKLAEQGSTVLAYDALQRAVQRCGRENVYFLVFEENRFVVDILDLIPTENVFAVRTKSLWGMIASSVRLLGEIRRKKIDTCVDLEFFARTSAVLSLWSGARIRVGFHATFGEGPYRGNLFTHRIRYNPHLHTSATFTSLIEAIDTDLEQLPAFPCQPQARPVPSLFAPEAAELNVVKTRLQAAGWREGRRIVVLNANAGDLLPLRKWAEGNYVELARRLLTEFANSCVVFTGSRKEAGRIRELVRSVGSERCIDLAGQTTLRELLALYGLAEVLVTNDSGPAHFAALTTIDVISLFGPETPLLFGALGARSHPMTAGLACSPCVSALNNRQTKCRNNLCMQAIAVDAVLARVKQVYLAR